MLLKFEEVNPHTPSSLFKGTETEILSRQDTSFVDVVEMFPSADVHPVPIASERYWREVAVGRVRETSKFPVMVLTAVLATSAPVVTSDVAGAAGHDDIGAQRPVPLM